MNRIRKVTWVTFHSDLDYTPNTAARDLLAKWDTLGDFSEKVRGMAPIYDEIIEVPMVEISNRKSIETLMGVEKEQEIRQFHVGIWVSYQDEDYTGEMARQDIFTSELGPYWGNNGISRVIPIKEEFIEIDQLRALAGIKEEDESGIRKVRKVVWISYQDKDYTGEQAEDRITEYWDWLGDEFKVFRLKPIHEEVINLKDVDPEDLASIEMDFFSEEEGNAES